MNDALFAPARIRRGLVAIKDRADSWLHPARRSRAAKRLRALEPRTILFVCLGNVCRSPYAEQVLAKYLPDRLIISAGFIGPGRPPPDTALEVAQTRGIEHISHRSKVITPEMARTTDAVFFFDRFNLQRLRTLDGVPMGRLFWLGDFEPEWGGKRAIPDPWGKPRSAFEETFARIDRCTKSVAHLLGAVEDK